MHASDSFEIKSVILHKKEYFTLSFNSFWNFSSFNRLLTDLFVNSNRNKRKAGRNKKKKKKGRKTEITLHRWKIFTIIVDGCWYTKDYDTRIQNRVRNRYQSQRLNRQQYLECTLLAESYAITIHCLSTHCERLTMWNSGHEAAMMPHAPPANRIKPTEC